MKMFRLFLIWQLLCVYLFIVALLIVHLSHIAFSKIKAVRNWGTVFNNSTQTTCAATSS